MARTRAAFSDLTRPPGRILVVRFSAMGDILLTLPAIDALARRWPDARISYLTDSRYTTMLAGHPAIDDVLSLDRLGLKHARPAGVRSLGRMLARVAGRRWDVVVDLQGFNESALLAWLARAPVRIGRHAKTRAHWLYSRWIGQPHGDGYMTGNHLETLQLAGMLEPDQARPPAGPWFPIEPAARAQWRERVPALPTRHAIALFIGAAKVDKLWPPAAFAEMTIALAADLPDDHSFLVLDGPDGAHRVAEVRRILTAAGLGHRTVDGGTGSVGSLAAAFQDCCATISNDTGPMHLSVAVGTPTLGIFRIPMPHFRPPPPHRGIVAPAGVVADLPVSAVLSEARALLADQRSGADPGG